MSTTDITPAVTPGSPTEPQRSPLARRLLAAGAALAATATIGAAAAAPALAAETHDAPARVDLNGRVHIGDPADAPDAVPDRYRAGQNVPIECQQEHAGAIWDRTADNLWVPDEHVGTGSVGFAPGIPRCDAPAPAPSDTLEGEDISNSEDMPDLTGKRFLLVELTVGTTDSLTRETGAADIDKARQQGVAAGGYHFAAPNGAPGSVQADHFIEHGGGWTPGQGRLPGALDLESPGESQLAANGGTCYGKSPAEIVAYIHSFVDRYRERTGTDPIIYTGRGWWDECTGGSTEFGDLPLWVAEYDVAPGEPGALPAGWDTWTIHQYREQPDLNRIQGGKATLDRLTAA